MKIISKYTVAPNELNQPDLKALREIDPQDRGLLFGDGVFETILIKNRRPAFLDNHLKRLLISINRLKIAFPVSPQRLREFIIDDIEDSGERDAILKIIITRGPSDGSLDFKNPTTPTIIVSVTPLSQIEKKDYRLIIAAERRNELSILSSMKTLNYLSNLAAKNEALMLNADDAILLNTKGEVTEASTANIFIVLNEQLITPPLEAGILPGITRNLILSGARALRMNEIAKTIYPEDIENASEVFLTNSIKGVIPVCQVNEKKFPGSKGKYINEITSLLINELEKECGR